MRLTEWLLVVTACLAMAELPWCYRIVPKKIAGLEDAPTMYSDKILVACASSATFTALGSM